MTLYVAINRVLCLNKPGKPASFVQGGQPLPAGALDKAKIDRLVAEGLLVTANNIEQPDEPIPTMPLDLKPGSLKSVTGDTSKLRTAKETVRIEQEAAKKLAEEREAAAALEAAREAAAKAPLPPVEEVAVELSDDEIRDSLND